jgi:N-acetylmuramoyl-L-alanine amidase
MSEAIRDHPSPNWDDRPAGTAPDMVILHYTGMRSGTAAIERLCNPSSNVSSHYVVDREGYVLRLVAEQQRAWHAGLSSWQGATNLNARSIGIELINPGHEHGYVDFTEPQMQALLRLLQGIHARHAIPRGRVLAHADVAPTRKCDPGERFDWRRLAAAGFGIWQAPIGVPGEAPVFGPGDAGEQVRDVQKALAMIGYGLAVTGSFDRATEQCMTAFQRHWRQQLVDGRADASSIGSLRAIACAFLQS